VALIYVHLNKNINGTLIVDALIICLEIRTNLSISKIRVVRLFLEGTSAKVLGKGNADVDIKTT